MSDTITGALIAALVSIIVAAIQNNSTRKLMEYQIQELKESVDKHNCVIERTYELERRADVVEEKIKVVNHRVDDLERNEKN